MLKLVGRGAADWREYYDEPDRRDLSLDQLADEYLADLEAKNETRSLKDFRSALKHARVAFGKLTPRDILPGYLDAWDAAQESAGLAPKTRAKHRALLSSLFEFGRRTGALDTNPVRRMVRKARAKPLDPKRTSLEILPVPGMTRMIYDRRLAFFHRVLWSVSLLAGVRIGEGGGIEWRDLAENTPCWELRLERQWSTKYLEMRPTKTDLVRHVPVHPELLVILDQARIWFRRRFRREPRRTDPIAPYPKPGFVAGRWNERTALKWWRKDLATLGVASPAAGERRLHCTRHTLITRLEKSGANPRAIRAFTHCESERESFDGYRHHEDWESMCEAMLCLKLDAAVREDCRRAVGDQLEMIDE